MNVYQMYYANNKKYGFFVQRNTWSNVIAKILEIDGVKEGDDIQGKNPYFNNQKVIAKFYKLDNDGNRSSTTGELSCPSNYSYNMINERNL